MEHLPSSHKSSKSDPILEPLLHRHDFPKQQRSFKKESINDVNSSDQASPEPEIEFTQNSQNTKHSSDNHKLLNLSVNNNNNSNYKRGYDTYEAPSRQSFGTSSFASYSHHHDQTFFNPQSNLKMKQQNLSRFSQKNPQNTEKGNKKEKVIVFKKTPHYFFDDLIPDKRLIEEGQKASANAFYRCLSHIEPIKSENVWMICWEMMLSLITIIKFFTIPLHIFFDNNGDDIFDLSYHPFTIIMIFLMINDMFLRFFRCYYDLGIAITDRKKIVNHYLSGLFIIDVVVLTSLLIELTSFGYSNSWISLIFYLRLINLNKFSIKLRRILQLRRKLKAIYMMMRLVVIILMVCHVYACFFYGLHTLVFDRDPHARTWVTDNQKGDKPDLIYQGKPTIYITALYWSATTIVTVGYGDLTPQNDIEMFYAAMVMISSCVIFGIVINNIYQIFEEVREGDKRFERNYSAIGRFMRDKGVKQNMQLKVGAFLEFHIKERNREKDMENQVIQSLPPAIRVKLIYRAYGKHFFGNIPWMKKQVLPPGFDKKNKKDRKGLYIFSKPFLMELSTHIKEIHYTEGEMVYKQGDCDDIEDIQNQSHCLYFVVKGRLQEFIDYPMYNDGKGILFRQFRKQEWFGELSFITGQDREYSVKALEYCTVYKVSKKAFLKVLEDYPQDYEKYCSLRDKLIFSKQYHILQWKCCFCEQQDHLAINCYRAHYVANKKELVSNNQKHQKQRKEFKRFDRPKLNILSLLQIVQEDCQKVQDNLIEQEVYETDQDDEEDEYASVTEDAYDMFDNSKRDTLQNIENDDQEEENDQEEQEEGKEENDQQQSQEQKDKEKEKEKSDSEEPDFDEYEEIEDSFQEDKNAIMQKLGGVIGSQSQEQQTHHLGIHGRRKKRDKSYKHLILSQVNEEDIKQEMDQDKYLDSASTNMKLRKKMSAKSLDEDADYQQFLQIKRPRKYTSHIPSTSSQQFQRKVSEYLERKNTLIDDRSFEGASPPSVSRKNSRINQANTQKGNNLNSSRSTIEFDTIHEQNYNSSDLIKRYQMIQNLNTLMAQQLALQNQQSQTQSQIPQHQSSNPLVRSPSKLKHQSTYDSESHSQHTHHHHNHKKRQGSLSQQQQLNNLIMQQLLLLNSEGGRSESQFGIQQGLQKQSTLAQFVQKSHGKQGGFEDQDIIQGDMDVDIDNEENQFDHMGNPLEKEKESFDIDKLMNFGNYMKDYNPRKIVKKVQQENKKKRDEKKQQKKDNKQKNMASTASLAMSMNNNNNAQGSQVRMSFCNVQQQQQVRRQMLQRQSMLNSVKPERETMDY